MLHLRIVAPAELATDAVEVLVQSRSACSVVHLPGVAQTPAGDLILADVAREDASVVLDDLKALGLEREGSIAIEEIDVQLSDAGDRAVEHARGAPSDAVVWEEVQSHTSEATELSASFLIFMVVAALIAAAGIYLDSPILIVGAMVVGPEFGPIAGFCVAAVTRRRDVALRSLIALAAGFPVAVAATLAATAGFRATNVIADSVESPGNEIAHLLSSPDVLGFFVAACAGIAGVLSLSTAKSGALVGVLISVTTIPAAANIGVAAAYGNASASFGSLAQLALNVFAILVFGTLTLAVQRAFYDRRRKRHQAETTQAKPADPGGSPAPAPGR